MVVKVLNDDLEWEWADLRDFRLFGLMREADDEEIERVYGKRLEEGDDDG